MPRLSANKSSEIQCKPGRQLSTENDTEIAEEIVEVLNEMCYGISIAEEIKAKEKVSISDQTIC